MSKTNEQDPTVLRCLKGETLAYREIYDRYAKAMFNTCFRLVNNRADAEDLLQESFTDAFKNLHRFQHESTLGAWLKQIVVNRCISFLKRKRVRLIDIDNGTDLPAAPDWEDEDWQLNLRVEAIHQGIRQLPDGYRTVLSLYLLEGYDHEEIAGILGLALSTTRTQYIRAKKRLLEHLQKTEKYEPETGRLRS